MSQFSPAATAVSVSNSKSSAAFEDDVWGDDSTGSGQQEHLLSDLPIVRRQHMNDGYRDGLTVGKAKVMQEGFDGGYPMGVEIGLRVGSIIGILEGYLSCSSITMVRGMRELVAETLAAAHTELAITTLLGGTDEATLASATALPASVDSTISYWEGLAYGVWTSRKQTLRIQDVQNGHAGRDLIEAKKMKPGFVGDETATSTKTGTDLEDA